MSLQKAETLIAENKKSKAPFLDLGNLGLTELPDSLFELEHLEGLNLGDFYFKDNRLQISQNSGSLNKLGESRDELKKLNKIPHLIFLGLEDNGIKNLDFLKEIPHLKALLIGYNRDIESYKSLSSFQDLNILSLRWNNISDIRFLEGMTGLQSLNLRSNEISDYSFLEGMTGLQSLDLSSNEISDYSFLEGMTGLQSLNLSSNKISDIRFLEGMTGLQSLNLSSNEISDIRFLEGMTGLESLYLGSNKISDIRFLEGMTGLQSLDLRSNKISDIRFLEGMTGLQSLNLRLNEISDYSFLEGMTGLQSLNLSSNEISDYSFLEGMTGLQSLNLSSNKISDIRFLEGMTGLQSLNLSSNEISDIRFLEGMTGLQSLDLSSNKISDYSFLEGMTGLQSLDLSSNKISDYSFLEGMTGLQSLNLSSNKISDIRFLEGMTGLQSLNLRLNEISDYSFLEGMTGLQSLNLSSNEISDYSFLEGMTGLQSLNLSSNKISDIRFLEGMTGLQSLNLSSNEISDIRFLEGMTGLQSLNLSSNEISDIRFLEGMTGLQSLYLSSNKISDLSSLRTLIEKGIPVKWSKHYSNVINVEDNPLINPPKEIIEQGNEAILAYFRQQEEQGTEPLMEAKLIIVGEPGAGKTSLMKKLIDETYPIPNPDKEESTLGINVHEGWTFEVLDDKEKNFSANLWDFGGQEIQYMTHQFFLTPSALYVLVADDRKQHTNFPYWFEAVHLLGKEGHIQSPILVVLNENKHQSISNYDHKHFKKTYPNTRLEVLEVDLSKVDQRYYHLKEKVQEMLCQLPHVGYELPKKWKVIRADLQELAKEHNHIPEQHFFDVCKKHSIEREQDQLLLSSYLHKLGSILHFQNETTLQDFVILNPQWAVDAVYCILEDKTVKEAQGVFTKEKVDELWNAYSRKERAMLLSMMMKENFEICYAISKHKYIAPQLLDNIRPDYDWDNTRSLKFRYQYRFLPKGVITRLIVRLNEYIAGHKGEHPGLVWEKGVVLEKDDCRAQVIEEDFPKQSIEIEIMGRALEKKFVLRWVRNEIEAIHQKWFPNVQFSQKVPCICDDCRQEPEPYFFDYSRLVKFHERGRPSDVCDNSLEDISVRALLEGIYEKEEYMPEYAKELLDGIKSVKRKITREHNKTRKAITDFEACISDQFREEYREMKQHLESVTFSKGELQSWMKKLDAALDNLSEQLSEAEAVKMQEALEASKPYNPKHKLKLKLDLYFAAYEVEYDMKEVWSDFKRFLRERGNSK